MVLAAYAVDFERQLRDKALAQKWPALAQTRYTNLQPRQRPGWAAAFLQYAYEWLDISSEEIEYVLRVATNPQAGYWFHAAELSSTFSPFNLYASSNLHTRLPLANLARTVTDITNQAYLAVAAEIFYLPDGKPLDFTSHLLGQQLGQDLKELATRLDHKLFSKRISALLLF